jgi:transposase
LPLYRQAEIMSRERINISRQILCQWTMRSSLALKPLYDLMITRILKSDNIFYDETPVSMLAPGRGKTKQAYMWVLV